MASHVRTIEQSTENPMECPTADATAHSVGYASTHVTQETLALDTDIYLLLWPETVPINDLSSIPSEDLGPFLNQEKDLLCIGDDKQVTLASLSEARLAHLVAQVKDSKGAESFLLWHGGVIAVLFPMGPQLHYVLDVQVEKVSSTEVCLQHLDPCAQERSMLQLTDPVELRVLSGSLLAGWSEEQNPAACSANLVRRYGRGRRVAGYAGVHRYDGQYAKTDQRYLCRGNALGVWRKSSGRFL